jgi:hypothetical protein
MRGVQVLLDIESGADGRVQGSVTPPGCDPARFIGWLELLHVLEACATAENPRQEDR